MPDAQTIYTIIHLIGMALGAGGAFMSDALFFYFLKQRDFSERNIAILKVGSKMVWLGLATLFISGLLLFSTAPEAYLHSSRFLIKMTIVLVLTLNGLVFHNVHLKHMAELKQSLFISGAISLPSWLLAIILGSMRGLALDYSTLLLFYAIVLVISCGVSLAMRRKIWSIPPAN